MPLDGITLGGIIFELNSLLSGGRIDRIQQPEKDEIILLIKNNARQHRLLISANAGSAGCILPGRQKRIRKRRPISACCSASI